MDIRSLSLKGTLLEPDALNGQHIEISLCPDPDLNKFERRKHERYFIEKPLQLVGALRKERAYIAAWVSFPEEVFPLITHAIVSNKIKIAYFFAEKMRYGKALIFNFSFQETMDE